MKLKLRKMLREFLVGAGIFSAACGYMFGIPALCKLAFPENGIFIGVMVVLSPFFFALILWLLGNIVTGIVEELRKRNKQEG